MTNGQQRTLSDIINSERIAIEPRMDGKNVLVGVRGADILIHPDGTTRHITPASISELLARKHAAGRLLG